MKLSNRLVIHSLALAVLAAPASVRSQQPQDLNEVLEDVSVEQRLGQPIPLDLEFTDSTGRTVRLEELFGERPVILSLVYYECPMLCNLLLNGLLRAVKALSLDIGSDFDVLTVSFDPSETTELAAAKKENYVKQYGRAGADKAWHFLTGKDDAIRPLTEAVGFRYHYNPVTDEYAHRSSLVVLTPDGRISRYFFGVEYVGRDLRLALVEASDRKIGTVVDEILLLCMHYDPIRGKYGVAIVSIMRLLGGATVVGLGGFVGYMLRKERRRHGSGGPDAASEETS